MRSFCHDVDVFPNPTPARNAGGDCFACALTAALRHFFGNDAPAFDQVWECFQREQTRGDTGERYTVLCYDWSGYRSAFSAAAALVGRRLESFVDLALPLPSIWTDVQRTSYAWSKAIDGSTWATRLDAWLRAGHLAFCSIKMDASPTGAWHMTDEGARQHTTDHFVLLDGVRWGWRKHPTVEGASTLVHQVHVVCSARGGRAYWIDVDVFLHQHGAGAWWLLRPEDYGPLVDA